MNSHATRPAIFITGAAAGIGRACAELFARNGWFVGIYDIDADGAASLAVSLGEEMAIAGALDVTDADAWQQALGDFCSRSGQRLDVLLNNAGVLTAGAFETIPLAKHDAVIEVNVRGVIVGCHSAFPYLSQTPHSHVINMASTSAIYGQPDLVTYSASKFAVRGFTEGLDLEWRKHGIRVSDIWPGFVQTAMAKDYGQIASARSLGVQLTAEDVAATVWHCATSTPLLHKTHWTVGLQARLMALGAQFGPRMITRWVVGRLTR